MIRIAHHQISLLFQQITTLCFFGLLSSIHSAEDTDSSKEAASILQQAGIEGGFIVQLDAGNGQLAMALGNSGKFSVHGLVKDEAQVTEAREFILKHGQYGKVSIDHLQANKRLPYINNLANLLVCESDPEKLGISMEEILRILRPNGIAMIKAGDQWKKTVKAWPKNIDDWTHYMHNADGNAVAHDTVVGPPRHLQWVGSPRWSRHHDRMASMSALVSSKGRLFYVMDEGSRISIELPPEWKLIARDAFNGTILWKRKVKTWHNHLWPLKSGPTQLARRLVAVGDHVFCTLGIDAPVTMMEAATGKTIRTFEGSEGTEELVVANGKIFLMAMKKPGELKDFLPQLNTGDQGRIAARYKWNEIPRLLMVFDTATGKKLWNKSSRISPLTLSADDNYMFFHDGKKVLCLDQENGDEIWSGQPADRRESMTFNFGPKLVLQNNLVLFAGGDRKMHVYDAATGKEKWTAPHSRGGYQSPEDLLVVKNLVWSAPTTSGKDSGIFTGRDILTGEIKKEFPPDVETYWFHHRCYIAKATDRFLMPSRTGIEFIDPETEHWDINHWVRGGCLYGVMPANGLTYAPPHNCACYPEAKLYGFNALSATGPRPSSEAINTPRLEKGPAFGKITDSKEVSKDLDWPTFRHDTARSGFIKSKIAADLKIAWNKELGGDLSSVVIAGNQLFVAQKQQHTVHAIDSNSGEKLWSFTAGGRIDSPPAIHKGSVLFGSADGYVYSLRASDGKLAWRFQAAPSTERHMAFEQLESVWPVHGNILVQDDIAYFVAGRSNFLDGGLRFYRLNASTGEKISETVIDEINPETGKNIQDQVKTLQMPVGLPDILSYDGGYVYMRSQQFDLNGKRLELGPHSGDAAEQGRDQRGGEHLFAPMSFLDDSYFHRSYWVFGRSFAGGHNGYYQAGKNAPSGRILVFDKRDVYGFGRKPEYLKWTTTMEHQLFAANREAPQQPASVLNDKGKRRGSGVGSMVSFKKSPSLNPSGKALVVEAWIKPGKKNDGTVLAQGGPADGYALALVESKPRFLYRSNNKLSSAVATEAIGKEWIHLLGLITPEKELQLYVNGKLSATGKALDFIRKDPAQGLEIGADDGSPVGIYKSPFPFQGQIDQVAIYHGSLSKEEIQQRFSAKPGTPAPKTAQLVLFCSFDRGKSNDSSGLKNHGQNIGAKFSDNGKSGKAIQLSGKAGKIKSSSPFLVKHYWNTDIPLLARAMLLADRTLFVAGPPDLIDEEESFKKLTSNDPAIAKVLARQDAALKGKEGALLWAVSADSGKKLSQINLPSLPVWDGMAAAHGKIYLATTDGRIICLEKK